MTAGARTKQPTGPAGDGLPRPHSDPLVRMAGLRLRLQGVATALAQSLDPAEVAARILDAACSALGAPQGWVAVVAPEGDTAEMLQVTGYAPETVAPWQRVPLGMPVPLTEVIVTGRPLYHASAAERTTSFPVLAKRRSPAADTEGSAVVPLLFEGRTTGALAVSFREPRLLEDDERWFLETLAAQGSQALERARLFQALQDRDARLRFTLEATGTGTWELDLVRDRLDWSPQAHRLHGIPEDATPAGLGAWLDQVPAEDRPRVREAIRECIRTGDPFDVEFRVVLPDGSLRWLQSVGHAILDPDGHPARMLGTTRDITDRRNAEAERDRVLEAEREAARLRDAFIGVVSHELRTPITTIFGGSRVLARRWRDMEPAARDDILRDIVDESDRLYRLVEDLLILTRVEGGTLDPGDEPIHVGRLLERITASERPRWPGVTFETVVPPALPTAAGEDTYVEQILRNLLGNAAKYGGQGSTVTVAADAEDDAVVIRVLDEGPGIDEAEADRLFELFYRSPGTAASVGGAGIGLFVCRQLVRAMGGTIRAERRPTGGAAFLVNLPRYRDEDDVP